MEEVVIEVLKEALDASRSVNEEYSERLEKMNVKITDQQKQIEE